jgi:hypothetical protein
MTEQAEGTMAKTSRRAFLQFIKARLADVATTPIYFTPNRVRRISRLRSREMVQGRQCSRRKTGVIVAA